MKERQVVEDVEEEQLEARLTNEGLPGHQVGEADAASINIPPYQPSDICNSRTHSPAKDKESPKMNSKQKSSEFTQSINRKNDDSI